MKTSRIFPYKRTRGEQSHYDAVHTAKNSGFKHPGSKPGHQLTNISRNHLTAKVISSGHYLDCLGNVCV